MILNNALGELSFTRLEMLETIRQMTELLMRDSASNNQGPNNFYHTLPIIRETGISPNLTHYASALTIVLEVEVKKP